MCCFRVARKGTFVALTERRKRWLALYREIRAKLKHSNLGQTKGWYRHHAKVRADMEVKRG